MTKKIKAFVVVGGTGGHVLPGCNLANHLIEKNYNVRLISDERGLTYIKKYKNFNVSLLPSSPYINRNLFTKIFSFIAILYSVFRSLIFLILNRPTIVFGMGGYASFPVCIAASILKIKFIIYENNLIIGKANKYLLPFANKVFVSYKELSGIKKKYFHKIFVIGNIIDKNIINFSKKYTEKKNSNKINILILGGSQAAKIFADKLPRIFLNCSELGISLKIYQHCLPSQNENLKLFYEKTNIDYETFNFTQNLIKYFSKTDLAITRSGSSMLAELTNANIPFISIPLPSSADNHQLKNAIYYQRKNFSLLIEEKDLNEKLLKIIKDIHENNTILNKIRQNQRQYSDKNVYNNINQLLKEIMNEKN